MTHDHFSVLSEPIALQQSEEKTRRGEEGEETKENTEYNTTTQSSARVTEWGAQIIGKTRLQLQEEWNRTLTTPKSSRYKSNIAELMPRTAETKLALELARGATIVGEDALGDRLFASIFACASMAALSSAAVGGFGYSVG